MGRRPFTLLVLLAVYLPLENFLLKWLPVSDTVYLWLRQLPEAALAALFVYALLRRIPYAPTRVPLIGGAADPALFAFVLLAVTGVALNDIDPASALANIKALLRYVSIVYVVMVLHPTEEEARRFGDALLLGAAIQLVIGSAQWLGGMTSWRPARRRSRSRASRWASPVHVSNRSTTSWAPWATPSITPCFCSLPWPCGLPAIAARGIGRAWRRRWRSCT
jgi:hypothetical protein